MTAQSKTIAVVGSSPFAWLLAGLLAADHSRAIVLLSDPPQPHRLWAEPASSVAPVTRPDTRALVAAHSSAAVKRLNRIAPGMVQRVDMAMGARGEAGKAAMGHIGHIMMGHRLIVEPLPSAGALSRMRVRDVWQSHSAAFLAVAARWLAASNVAVVHSRAGLKIRRDGRANFGATTIDLVVLADDAAILEWLGAEDIAGFARTGTRIGIQTTPVRQLEQKLMFDLDSGASWSQAPDGSLLGAASDGGDVGLGRLAAALPADLAPRLAAKAYRQTLVPHDGAPVIGRTRRGGVYIVSGLGPLDLMLAPMIAGLIAGTASGLEAEWAAAHGADLRQPRADVADYQPSLAQGGGR